LAKTNVEVYIIAPHADKLKKMETLDGVHVHRFQYMYPSGFQSLAYFPGIPENIKKYHNKVQVMPFALSMANKLLGIVRKHDIDVINAHWAIPSGAIAVLAKKLHKLPVVTKIYGADLNIIKYRYPMFKPLLKKVIVDSDTVIANSEYTRSVACEMLKMEKTAIKVIPDGVDVNYFKPHEDEKHLKARFNLEGNYIVLSCGRMVERKGFEYLVRAMPNVVTQIPNVKLILVGDGPERPGLESLASALGIANHVVFAGKVSDGELPTYYSLCDMFVLPAIIDSDGDTEGLGLVVVEAMASGKPVIASNVGGIPTILPGSGEYGYLVRQKDISELSTQIIRLLSDESLRKKFGGNARIVAENKFSWEAIAQQYRGVFENMRF
jgi:N-acetyl-alpha-D-glucosaminyl L-malate synthase BshA